MSQKEEIFELLKDYKPHTTLEIMRKVYKIPGNVGVCRIASRIAEIRRHGWEVKGFPSEENRKIYCYQLIGDKSEGLNPCVAHASGEAPATPNFKNDLFEELVNG